jgi:hypothetical protein
MRLEGSSIAELVCVSETEKVNRERKNIAVQYTYVRSSLIFRLEHR